MSNPPIVRRDRNDSSQLSVTYDFKNGQIPKVKIKTSRSQWWEWYWTLDPDNVHFSEIESSIRGAGKKKKAIEQYANDTPHDFSEDFFRCVWESSYQNKIKVNSKGEADLCGTTNPLSRVARGKTFMGDDNQDKKTERHSELSQVRATSGHLYIFLHHWFGKPKKERPTKLKRLCTLYDTEYPQIVDPVIITQQIVAEHFKLPELCEIEPDSFYKHYIAFLPLEKLKKIKRFRLEGSHLIDKLIS